MEHNEVDVTHTIKATESKGRQLIKNLDTGKTRWVGECDDEEHDIEPVKSKPKKVRAPSTQD